MGEFRMPSLGADMDVGTIVEWLVGPGDAVKHGQIVAVVDTAKAAIEIEAFEDGVIEDILIGTGKKVPVGTPLAIIRTAIPEAAGATRSGRPTPASRRPRSPTPPEPAPTTPAEPQRATPPLRHLAQQLGVDLDAIAGSGPDGRITHNDVLLAIPTQAPGEPTATVAPATATPTQSVRTPESPGPATPDRTAIAPRGGGSRGRGATGRPKADSSVGERLRVTPRARRIAAERGIELTDAVGTGEAGAVLGADVERIAERPAAAAASSPAQPPRLGADTTAAAVGATRPATAATSEKKAAMRTAIANLMSRSNTEIPHFYVTQMIDLANAMAWLRNHNATLPVARRALSAALFLRATVLGATAVPDLNGHWVEGSLRPAQRIDLGVAVATRGGGLVTPAIPDAGPLQIDDLMAALSDLVSRARRGNLRQSEMAGASITVSNLGETGPDALHGVIFPPQVALIGIGGIVERPWAVNGMLAVRPTVTVTVAADHRASDGRTASAFLASFTHALQNPEEL